MRPLSLRTRLSAWYTLGLGTTLVAFGVIVTQAMLGTLRHEYDERVESAAGVVQFAVRDAMRDLGPQATAQALLRQLRFIDVGVAIRTDPVGLTSVVEGPGSWFAGSDSALAGAHAPRPCQAHGVERQRLGPVSYRLLIHCLPAEDAAPALTVVVGAPEKELTDEAARIRRFIAIVLLAGLVLTTLGGHWLSGKALAPIRRMAAQLQRIGSENLGDHLRVSPGEGEIAVLSRMVNELLDRLKATVARERHFLANAAHALRTPVAVLLGDLSEASQRDDLTPPTQDLLAQVRTWASHMGRTIEYLLSLARRDAGLEPIVTTPLYLDDVVSGTVARVARMGERRQITIVWDELQETPAMANADVVDQVTQVLLENALQYAPDDGTVTIRVGPEDGTARLVVEDNGPGLEPGDRDALFTPFVRGSAARRTGAPGSGLGLAVAHWMVTECGGSIVIEPVLPHGARFVVRFPSPAR